MRAPGESRRAFLESMGLAGAGAILAGSAESARGYQANDTISVGCLGTGGRCRTLMKSLAGLPNVRMVAVCDTWDVAPRRGARSSPIRKPSPPSITARSSTART